MKKFLVLLSLLFSSFTYADTINLHWLNEDGTTYQNSTCVSDSDLILPSTPPTKYGYTFTGWKMTNYIPIEYLESTGTQYIDTGFKPNNNSGFYIDYYANSSLQPRVFMLAQNLNDTPYGFGIVLGRSANIAVYNGKRIDNNYWLCNDFTGIGRYIININKTEASITDSTSTQRSFTFPSNMFQFTQNLYLFALNSEGTIIENTSSVRIYSCKIYDNGELVRDFIPVLDANGTPCMYDRVEGKIYYNAGTGQFIAGPSL